MGSYAGDLVGNLARVGAAGRGHHPSLSPVINVTIDFFLLIGERFEIRRK